MITSKSLAVRYRPQSFGDVIEQNYTIKILQGQINTKTLQNCYLFTGSSGIGKTTIARIFANEINKGKGNPIEIDAASNNSVENVRTIIEDASFKSLDSEYKIYIMDEVHMLSNSAWNAMLKLIEEPPAQTIFMFCTTDPQKIPNTILSRVQRHDLKRITQKAIVERLKQILEWEHIKEYEHESIEYIAKIANGGMRDAISMLDKVISFSQNITIDNTIKALGNISYNKMFELTNAIIDCNLSKIIEIINEEYNNGVDLREFIKQYSSFLLDVFSYYILGNFEHMQIPSTYEDILVKYSEEDYQFILKMLDEILKLHSEIKWESNPKPLIIASLLLLSKED